MKSWKDEKKKSHKDTKQNLEIEFDLTRLELEKQGEQVILVKTDESEMVNEMIDSQFTLQMNHSARKKGGNNTNF